MGALVWVAMTLACSDDAAGPIEVTAEVLEPDAPVSVTTSDVVEGNDGLLHHEVRVQWNGEEARRLDDARFTHHVDGDNGDLITAGRHCGADWDAQRSQVSHPCLMDLQIIVLAAGETHPYPVVIYPELGPLRLRPGTYVVEEVIHWWPVDDFGVEPFQSSEDFFTVRLTYEVR